MSGTWEWGTVVTAPPGLTVLFPGDDEPTPATSNGVPALVVGDRVWCQRLGRALIVHLKAHPI